MVGYAYINPLAGLSLYPTIASYHAMAGYAYINPLAIPLCYRGLCLHQPLSGVDRSHSLSLSPYVIGGYAYINPLAGLIAFAAALYSPLPPSCWWWGEKYVG